MSAGGLSYSGLTSYGKSTLPSVESWSTNMNILRDPKASIYTRRIDKVGATSEITQMVEESGDRLGGINEVILTYARGVNPMVAVDFSNYGNNGGQKKGGSNNVGFNNNGNKNAYLPHRILNGGAFRPPIRDQRSLLPLSRLPRVWTSSFTNPGFTDFSKRAMCPTPSSDTETKGIKNSEQMLRPTFVSPPTSVYQLDMPVIEPFEVRYVIKNPLQFEQPSGKNPTKRVRGEYGDATQEIIKNPMRQDKNINKGGNITKNGDISISTDKYLHDQLQGNYYTNKSENVQKISIDELYNYNSGSKNHTHDVLTTDVNSNISRDIQHTSINELYQMDMNNKTRDNFNISHDTTKTGYEKNDYIHGDVKREKTLPSHQSHTNSGLNIHKQQESQTREYIPNRPNISMMVNSGGGRQQNNLIMNRDYILKPTISSQVSSGSVSDGGYTPGKTVPQTYHDNGLIEFDAHKSDMRQKIYNMQQDRNVFLGGSVPNPYALEFEN